MTEAGHVRLTLTCSRDDVSRLGLRAGDWAWLSDGEVIVGAQLAIDDRYGLVGVPDWDTIVPLDEEGANDGERIKAALVPLLTREPRSPQDEPRILQLITQFEHAARSNSANRVRGTYPSDVFSHCARWGSLAWPWSRRKRPDAPVLRTRKSRSSISISSDGRTSLPLSSKPRPSPSRRTCQPSSCRRASTSSRPKRSRRPTTILSRSPGGPRLVSAARSGPGSRSSGAFARGLVLLQPGIRAPSSGPDLSGSTGIRTRPPDLSRRPDA